MLFWLQLHMANIEIMIYVLKLHCFNFLFLHRLLEFQRYASLLPLVVLSSLHVEKGPVDLVAQHGSFKASYLFYTS